jgi:Histone methylation protein DOT1
MGAEPAEPSFRLPPRRSPGGVLERLRVSAVGGFLRGCRLARRFRRHLASLAFDRRLGVNTAGHVSLREFNLDRTDRVDYEPSGWLTLRHVLSERDVSESDVFLDFGSGKGQIVLQAAMYPFRRVLGVEISPQLHEIAVQNVERASRRLRCKDIILVNSPAEQFHVPDDVTVAYFYNPFRGEAFATVVRELLASVDRNPRPLRIIYHNARDEDVLLATGRVQVDRTVLAVAGNAPTRVYRLVPATQPAA